MALRVAGYFEAGYAAAASRKVAANLGLTPREIDRMSSAFDQEDLKAALSLGAARKARTPHRER